MLVLSKAYSTFRDRVSASGAGLTLFFIPHLATGFPRNGARRVPKGAAVCYREAPRCLLVGEKARACHPDNFRSGTHYYCGASGA